MLVSWQFLKWSPWLKQNIWTPEIHILLEQHVCRFTALDRILCFLRPKEKRCSWPQTTSSPYSRLLASRLWAMRSYCCRLHDPSSSHEFGHWQNLGIFGFPSLKNCTESIIQQKAAFTTFRWEVHWYSPVATSFPIHYCTLKTIRMTCHYNNIFFGKTRYRTTQTVLLPGRSCLEDGPSRLSLSQ